MLWFPSPPKLELYKLTKATMYKLDYDQDASLKFNTTLTTKVGLYGAVMFEKIMLSRITKSSESHVDIKDGNYSKEFFTTVFPYFSHNTMRKNLIKLERYGVIVGFKDLFKPNK